MVIPVREHSPASDEMDEATWKQLPADLVDKCLGHLPVLTIVSKLREVNRSWRDFPGTPQFMSLHNHGQNVDSSFGFLMHGTNNVTQQCETMSFNHNTLKWQMGPSLQLEKPYFTCQVDSVSEGLLCVSPHSANSQASQKFIVWNPLLPPHCTLETPPIPSNYYWSVNLVVDRANSTFTILAFSEFFRTCYTYSSATNAWRAPFETHTHTGPQIPAGVGFSINRDWRLITATHNNCLYVALQGCTEVGDLCFDINRGVWKSPVTLSAFFCRHCVVSSLITMSNVMYMVIEYDDSVHQMGEVQPCRPVKILARSIAETDRASNWAVITTTFLPRETWVRGCIGPWYGCFRGEHGMATICAMFREKPELYLVMYSIHSGAWETVCLSNEATNALYDSRCLQQEQVNMTVTTRMSMRSDFLRSCFMRSAICRKWLCVQMEPQYAPSWMCPAVPGSCACKPRAVASTS